MYKAGKPQKVKHHNKRWLLLVLLGLIGLGWVGYSQAKTMLKPDTVISESKAKVSTFADDSSKTQQYDEPNFSITLPISWKMIPRDQGTYQTYTWQISNKGTDGQQIQIFEDTLPPGFAVNRALIIAGEGDHVSFNGAVSDNCITYTKNVATDPNGQSAPARWQGTDFRCDVANLQRNVVGTSSTDGINTVILRSPKTGTAHKYFFTFTAHDLNPDYTPFTNALTSFKMQ